MSDTKIEFRLVRAGERFPILERKLDVTDTFCRTSPSDVKDIIVTENGKRIRLKEIRFTAILVESDHD